jgi:hypothetical protein
MNALSNREVTIRDDVLVALPRRRRIPWILGQWRVGDRVARLGLGSPE